MRLEDFSNIDFKNSGRLPPAVKAVLLLTLFAVLVAAGYWFFWKPALAQLEVARNQEAQLRQLFLTKKKQAINLAAYKKQMEEVDRTFGEMLKQLPDKSQMAALLTDINQAGLSRGLEFELFKPGKEVVGDFYAELPIQIKVLGNYHDLGGFAEDISRLPRIVTLNDVVITKVSAAKKSRSGPVSEDRSALMLEAVAKTYRYLDAEELASKKAAETKARNTARAKARKKS
jgi:type IV pilus assembly protein PilO